jgi:hypothetical protein
MRGSVNDHRTPVNDHQASVDDDRKPVNAQAVAGQRLHCLW